MDDKQVIGNRIKTLRKRKGWTQDKLVEVARRYTPEGRVLNRESISSYENKHARPDSWVALTLAQALGVSVEYLMGEKPPVMLTPAPELLDVVEAANRLPPQKRREVAELVKAGLVLINYDRSDTTEPESVAQELDTWAAQWTTADELDTAQDQASGGTLFDDDCAESDADCQPVGDTVLVSTGGRTPHA